MKSAYSGWSYRDNKTSSEAGMMCLKPLVIDLSQPNGEPNEAFEATKAEFVEYARKQDVLFLKGYGVEGRPPPIPHGPDKFNSIQAFWSKTGARAGSFFSPLHSCVFNGGSWKQPSRSRAWTTYLWTESMVRSANFKSQTTSVST